MTWSNESRHARGYGRRWVKLREVILARDKYLCHCSRCQGGKLRLTPANQVDHIQPKSKGGTDDPSNLRAINAKCHQRVTAEQQGKRWRRTISVDGWPVDD